MIITEEEAGELKTWVVKKLEDISDADSDVLADYVLALIRADTPEPELRLNAIENLEDFLKDNTAAFVDAIFVALHTRSYMPGHVPLETPPLVSHSYVAPTTSPITYPQAVTSNGAHADTSQSRKRSYNDRSDETGVGDSHYGRGDRQMKQMRRGGSKNGRAELFNAKGGRGAFSPYTTPPVPQETPLNFPNMPVPPPGLPFDLNDPLTTMMALQTLGIPPFPGMPIQPQTGLQPSLPQTGLQTNSHQFGTHASPMAEMSKKTKINARCRDYDTKGYCARGNSCPFEHGNDHVVVPGQDEYDPKNSVMMDLSRTPTSRNGNISLADQRGNIPNRSTARGRGDRGGHTHPRRNRAEFSYSGPNHDLSITTIVVEQIPEDRFNEQSVRDFFIAFGTVEEVTMQAYKRLALVKFSDYASARRAYDSPKVIFDNRFVKVYWYKPENAPTVSPSSNVLGASVSSSSMEEQSYDREKYERDALAAQKKLEEKKRLIRDTEAKRQALEKQKEELALRQAEEKKRLLEKIAAKEKGAGANPTSGLQAADKGAGSTNGTDDSNVSAQTKALRAQVAVLEAEAKSLGLDTTLTEDNWAPRGRGRGRGRGSYRGWEGFAGRGSTFDSPRGNIRGRGAFRGGRGGGGYNLDNRTKKVSVSGVELDSAKDEALRQYLLGIGEFEAVESQGDRQDTQVVIFKDRFTAEQFIYGTKDIPGVGKVELGWVNTPLPPVKLNTKSVDATLDSKDTGMGDANADGDNGDKAGEVDYDVAEEDDRWMVE